MLDPFHQFVISPILKIKIGGLDLSFTNSSLAIMVTFLMITAVSLFGIKNQKLAPNRIQASFETIYILIADLVESNLGKAGKQYFPFVFSLFLFVLFGNIIGLIPGMFTFTSHIIVTFFLALTVILFVTVLGFILHGIKFFKLFVPEGVSKFLTPLLIFIELASYLIRPVSLALRLFVNMMAGHTLIKVFAGLAIVLADILTSISWGAYVSWVAYVTAIVANIGLTGLELVVAVLQAYIFAVLTCVYMKDAVHLH
jgi:F-type H+-transporting ATPase subunit a